MTAESDFGTTEGKRMKTPIEVGRYRLRNGRFARVNSIGTVHDVRVARGVIEDTNSAIEWTADDGFLGIQPGPWDLVERIDSSEPMAQDAMTVLRRSHAAFQTIATEHRRMASEAEKAAQEIEHRIREMERRER